MRSERSEGLIPAPRGPASTHPHLFQGEPQEAGPACAEPASRRSAPRSGGGQAPAHAVGLTRDYQSSVLPTDSAEDPVSASWFATDPSRPRHAQWQSGEQGLPKRIERTALRRTPGVLQAALGNDLSWMNRPPFPRRFPLFERESTGPSKPFADGRIPDFPVTRSHPPASWPSAANSSICRTYRKTAGEESRRRSPVANRWMRP